jgi:hypothetical protein
VLLVAGDPGKEGVTGMMLFLEPPPQYDHPYHGQVVEQRLSFLQLVKLCHGLTTGCSWVSNGVCYIALSQDEKDDRLIALMRQHEIGHCNGWPGNHQGGRRVEYDEDKRATTQKQKPGHLNVTLF